MATTEPVTMTGWSVLIGPLSILTISEASTFIITGPRRSDIGGSRLTIRGEMIIRDGSTANVSFLILENRLTVHGDSTLTVDRLAFLAGAVMSMTITTTSSNSSFNDTTTNNPSTSIYTFGNIHVNSVIMQDLLLDVPRDLPRGEYLILTAIEVMYLDFIAQLNLPSFTHGCPLTRCLIVCTNRSWQAPKSRIANGSGDVVINPPSSNMPFYTIVYRNNPPCMYSIPCF
jgi:hypothetical protein